MIRTADCDGKKISGNAAFLNNQRLTAGRQNLLSAIWGDRNVAVVSAMPNGDPPSLMLWGAEDQMSQARYNAGHGGVHAK